MESDIESQVKNIVAKQLDVKPELIDKETTLCEMGGDSLDKLEIIQEIEIRFCVDISDVVFSRIVTIGDLIKSVKCGERDHENYRAEC